MNLIEILIKLLDREDSNLAKEARHLLLVKLLSNEIDEYLCTYNENKNLLTIFDDVSYKTLLSDWKFDINVFRNLPKVLKLYFSRILQEIISELHINKITYFEDQFIKL